MSGARNCPVAFDPAAFVADMHAVGYGICAYWPVPRGGEKAKPPSYFIQPPEDGFGTEYATVISRWRAAMDACPDHVVLVADYVFKCSREAHRAFYPCVDGPLWCKRKVMLRGRVAAMCPAC